MRSQPSMPGASIGNLRMEAVARISSIRQETPTVKSLLLELSEGEISFLPGQWLDLYIDDPLLGPEVEVAGLSITSSPLQKRSIELAVKKIPEGRASVYLHEKAQVGDELVIDGGYGDFYYREGMADYLVLIAGGIGITPLMSMIRFVDQAGLDVDVALLYSSSTPSELLFLQELKAISSRNEKIACAFTVTQPGGESWDGQVGRIDRQMLEEKGVSKKALYYACGPRGFAEDMATILLQMGVDASSIKREEW